MLPPAPARFSTTTCWPSSSPSAGAMMRAVVSVPPPGSKPTTVVIAFCGHCAAAAALNDSAANANSIFFITSSGLPPFENGLAFFHEGSAAFCVILAREAFLHPRLGRRGVVVLLRHLADDALRGAHRQRRVGGNAVANLASEGFELLNGDHMMDQPHRFRLGGAELPRGDHDLAGVWRADGVDQVLHRRGAVAQAQPRRRDAEAAVLGGDAQVAEQR